MSTVRIARVGRLTWPPGAVLVAVHRRNGLAYPHPDTELNAVDAFSVLTRRGVEQPVRDILTIRASSRDDAHARSSATISTVLTGYPRERS